MSEYLSEVLAVEEAVSETDATLIVASGGTGGASFPVLKEEDVQEPEKGSELKLKKVKFSKAVESALAEKQKSCSGIELDVLRAVYRRGAGSYDAAETNNITRHSWAMARVDAFSTLCTSPSSVFSSYTADYDLLPVGHELSTRAVTASVSDEELAISLLAEDEYTTQEEAIFSLAEFSGLGYETIPALRASWMRGIKNNENPFERAAVLASALYDSQDADLLPLKGIL